MDNFNKIMNFRQMREKKALKKVLKSVTIRKTRDKTLFEQLQKYGYNTFDRWNNGSN